MELLPQEPQPSVEGGVRPLARAGLAENAGLVDQQAGDGQLHAGVFGLLVVIGMDHGGWPAPS